MRLFVFLVTFVVFTIEALMHFVAGKMSASDLSLKQSMPSLFELGSILGIVAGFSVVNAYVIGHPTFHRFMSRFP